MMYNDYETMLTRNLEAMPTQQLHGVPRSIMANRISNVFDWRGPSMVVDTACSSSLIALHLAIQALREGTSRVALACGSNLLRGPDAHTSESEPKLLSADSVSQMLDKKANGYARGDGVVAVVLKTLSAAIEDGNDIESFYRECCG